jgi:hypothetical protein
MPKVNDLRINEDLFVDLIGDGNLKEARVYVPLFDDLKPMTESVLKDDKLMREIREKYLLWLADRDRDLALQKVDERRLANKEEGGAA